MLISFSVVIRAVFNSVDMNESVVPEFVSGVVFEEVIVESTVSACLVCECDDISIVTDVVTSLNSVDIEDITVSDVVCFGVGAE